MINLPGYGPTTQTNSPASGKGLINLPGFSAPTKTPASPSVPQTAPKVSGSTNGIPNQALEGNLGGGYGTSNVTDKASGKPLLTFENTEAQSSQLLGDRTAPSFDPTVPQKIDPSTLQNGRMPESVSQAIKAQFPGSTADELDHIMPLELGGSNNKSNLRLEGGDNQFANYSPGSNPTPTDPLENSLTQQAHNGKISLVDAWKLMGQAKGITLPEQGGTDLPQDSTANFAPEKGTSILDSFQKETNGSVLTDPARQDVLKNLPGLTQSLADLQTNPLSLGSSLTDILTTPFTDANQASVAFNTALANLITGIKSNAPASQKISDGLEAATALGSGALLPITTWFNMANKIPIVGSISKLLFNVPFSALGDVSGDTGVAAMNQLPISDQAKANLEPGIRAISQLVGMIVGGKYVAPDVLDILTKQFGPEDAKTIQTQAENIAQETPKVQPTAPEEKPTLNDIVTKPETTTEIKPTEEIAPNNKTPVTNSSEIDLRNKDGKPVNDITPPEKTPNMTDAVIDKLKPTTRDQKTADILASKTPVTVDGSQGSFKVTSDKGGENVKVVNLATGNEEEVPRETVSETSNETVKTVRRVGALKSIEGTGETKIRGLSEGIEAKAIENKIADRFGDLPEYKTVNMADQAKRALDFLNKDPENAKAVAMGDKQAPKGIVPEHVLIAVENRAIEEGDTQTLKDLASSKLATEATTMGQRIRSLAERDPESPTARIKEIQDAREKAAQEKLNSKSLAQEKNDIVKKEGAKLEEKIKSARPKRIAWAEFVESIKC